MEIKCERCNVDLSDETILLIKVGRHNYGWLRCWNCTWQTFLYVAEEDGTKIIEVDPEDGYALKVKLEHDMQDKRYLG